MRIGYFGGSFDPPHRGHLTVACAARDRFCLDRVLLAPTGRQPFKPGGSQASFSDRLHMTALLCAGEDRLEASALDAPRPDGKPNYTVDTLHLLQEQNSDSGAAQALPELFLITGADAFLGVPKWRSPDELFRLAQWIVVSRPDTPFSRVDELALTPEQRLRVHLLDGVADPISATELRRRLAAREDCRGLLPAPVLEYVQAHHLYGRDPAQTASNADNGMR